MEKLSCIRSPFECLQHWEYIYRLKRQVLPSGDGTIMEILIISCLISSFSNLFLAPQSCQVVIRFSVYLICNASCLSSVDTLFSSLFNCVFSVYLCLLYILYVLQWYLQHQGHSFFICTSFFFIFFPFSRSQRCFSAVLTAVDKKQHRVSNYLYHNLILKWNLFSLYMLIQSFKGFALRGHHIHHKRVKVAPLKGKKTRKNRIWLNGLKPKSKELTSSPSWLPFFLFFSSVPLQKQKWETIRLRFSFSVD